MSVLNHLIVNSAFLFCCSKNLILHIMVPFMTYSWVEFLLTVYGQIQFSTNHIFSLSIKMPPLFISLSAFSYPVLLASSTHLNRISDGCIGRQTPYSNKNTTFYWFFTTVDAIFLLWIFPCKHFHCHTDQLTFYYGMFLLCLYFNKFIFRVININFLS